MNTIYLLSLQATSSEPTEHPRRSYNQIVICRRDFFCHVIKKVEEILRLPPGMIVVVKSRVAHILFLPSTEPVHTLHTTVQSVLIPFRVHAQLHGTHDVTRLFTEGAQYVPVHCRACGKRCNVKEKLINFF